MTLHWLRNKLRRQAKRETIVLFGESRAHRSDQLDSPFLQTPRVKNGILRHYQYYLSASKTLEALAMQWSQKYSRILCDTGSPRVPWQMSIVCDTGYLCVCMNPCKGSKNKSLTALIMYLLRETRSTQELERDTTLTWRPINSLSSFCQIWLALADQINTLKQSQLSAPLRQEPNRRADLTTWAKGNAWNILGLGTDTYWNTCSTPRSN